MALIRPARQGVAGRNALGVGEGRARHTHTAAAHADSSMEGLFPLHFPGSQRSAGGEALCVVGSQRNSLLLGAEIPNRMWDLLRSVCPFDFSHMSLGLWSEVSRPLACYCYLEKRGSEGVCGGE